MTAVFETTRRAPVVATTASGTRASSTLIESLPFVLALHETLFLQRHVSQAQGCSLPGTVNLMSPFSFGSIGIVVLDSRRVFPVLRVDLLYDLIEFLL